MWFSSPSFYPHVTLWHRLDWKDWNLGLSPTFQPICHTKFEVKTLSASFPFLNSPVVSLKKNKSFGLISTQSFYRHYIFFCCCCCFKLFFKMWKVFLEAIIGRKVGYKCSKEVDKIQILCTAPSQSVTTKHETPEVTMNNCMQNCTLQTLKRMFSCIPTCYCFYSVSSHTVCWIKVWLSHCWAFKQKSRKGNNWKSVL